MTMTLRELIAALEAVPADHHIYFDFGQLYPDGFSSWRGSYECLALEWATATEINQRNGGYKQPNGPSIKVSELLEDARRQNGASYEGYKGGTFHMGLDTDVWVDRYGQSSCTAIKAIDDNGSWAIIRTAREDY